MFKLFLSMSRLMKRFSTNPCGGFSGEESRELSDTSQIFRIESKNPIWKRK